MKKILVTDSLFILDEHVKRLKEAGYEVERLDKPDATEDELLEALQDKVGYICGGIEKATKRVLENATELKAIGFPGIGYKWLIPGWEYAKEKGIMISNTPDAPTNAVAEWAMMTALLMQRAVFEIGRTGGVAFKTTPGLEGKKVGIYGLGRIGTEIARKMKLFKPQSISYYSKHQHENIEKELGIIFTAEYKLLRDSEIIFICVPDEVGKSYFDDAKLEKVSENSLIISIAHEGIININALDKALARGVRIANDDPIPELAAKYGPEKLFTNLGHNAFNTEAEIKRASDEVVESIINLLETGKDQYRVV